MAEGDIDIPPVSAGQAMSVLAVAVCNTINSFAQPEDSEEEKTTRAQVLFSIFVHQLSGFSKNPKTIARLLRAVADEMDAK